MVWKKNILFFILIANAVQVHCDCGSYSDCVGSFISNFFNGVNYFQSIKSYSSNNTDYGEGDINNILVNISSFLRSDWENNDTIDTRNVFQNVDNDTSLFVRAINIGEDIDFYNIFDDNQTLVSPEVFNIEEFSSSNNESSITYETIVPKNVTFQPLVFNFSEILAPVNFNTSEFPQIKIEHYNVEKDQHENEISDADFQEYYDFNEDNSTDYPIIDYIDLYKDTTNEIVVSNSTERYNANNIDVTENVGQLYKDTTNEIVVSNSTERYNANNIDVTENVGQLIKDSLVQVKKYKDKGFVDGTDQVKEDAQAIFPWIAAIFIKNDTSDQFSYYCDGALLSNKTIVTAARCIRSTNYSVEANDIIVLLGKSSLQSTNENERVAKVEDVFIHDNFTSGSENDIAVLSLEDEVELCENIQPARLGDETEYDEAYTTGWAFTGELTAIRFQKESNCDHYLQDNKTFCAAYGNEVTVCPSYGGLFAMQSNSTWYLQGIRTADPTERAVCINRPVVFTALEFYYAWLSQFV